MGIELRGGITLKRQPPKWGINQLITPKEYFASTIYTRYTTSGRTGLQISIDFLRFLVQAPPHFNPGLPFTYYSHLFKAGQEPQNVHCKNPFKKTSSWFFWWDLPYKKCICSTYFWGILNVTIDSHRLGFWNKTQPTKVAWKLGQNNTIHNPQS